MWGLPVWRPPVPAWPVLVAAWGLRCRPGEWESELVRCRCGATGRTCPTTLGRATPLPRTTPPSSIPRSIPRPRGLTSGRSIHTRRCRSAGGGCRWNGMTVGGGSISTTGTFTATIVKRAKNSGLWPRDSAERPIPAPRGWVAAFGGHRSRCPGAPPWPPVLPRRPGRHGLFFSPGRRNPQVRRRHGRYNPQALRHSTAFPDSSRSLS